jgi:hypothetical protein
MTDQSTVDPSHPGEAFTVTIRRPLQSLNPNLRFRKRWRARMAQRRAARAERKQRGERTRWWEAIDVPDLDAGAAALLAIVAAILLVVLLILVGPFLWIVVLFLVEALVWFALAVAGLVAWLLFGRPWHVVVADRDNNTLASVPVRGRRRAREHAVVVQKRLSEGATPTAAATMTADA